MDAEPLVPVLMLPEVETLPPVEPPTLPEVPVFPEVDAEKLRPLPLFFLESLFFLEEAEPLLEDCAEPAVFAWALPPVEALKLQPKSEELTQRTLKNFLEGK